MTVDRPAFVVHFPVVVNLVVNISSAVGRHGGVKPQGLDNVRLATADVSLSVMQQSLGETAMVDIKGCRFSILRVPFSCFTCPTPLTHFPIPIKLLQRMFLTLPAVLVASLRPKRSTGVMIASQKGAVRNSTSTMPLRGHGFKLAPRASGSNDSALAPQVRLHPPTIRAVLP